MRGTTEPVVVFPQYGMPASLLIVTMIDRWSYPESQSERFESDFVTVSLPTMATVIKFYQYFMENKVAQKV